MTYQGVNLNVHPLAPLFREMAHAYDTVADGEGKQQGFLLKVMEKKLVQFMKNKNIPHSGTWVPVHAIIDGGSAADEPFMDDSMS